MGRPRHSLEFLNRTSAFPKSSRGPASRPWSRWASRARNCFATCRALSRTAPKRYRPPWWEHGGFREAAAPRDRGEAREKAERGAAAETRKKAGAGRRQVTIAPLR